MLFASRCSSCESARHGICPSRPPPLVPPTRVTLENQTELLCYAAASHQPSIAHMVADTYAALLSMRHALSFHRCVYKPCCLSVAAPTPSRPTLPLTPGNHSVTVGTATESRPVLHFCTTLPFQECDSKSNDTFVFIRSSAAPLRECMQSPLQQYFSSLCNGVASKGRVGRV